MTRVPTEVRHRAALLFQQVYRLDAASRAQRLDQVCAGDEALRRAVEDLLFHNDAPQGALDALGAARERARGVPDAIGPYRIEGVLGRGGMGIVYKAQQARPRRTVALKVLQPGLVREEMLKRFEQEAELLALLQHPGIAHVYDAGSCELGYGEMPYFAMELVEGEPLTQYADARSLDVHARCALFVKVCDAVQHAHERGIVHRDLKPANILVPDPESGQREAQPKVLDFGIARSTNTDLQLSTMQTGSGVLLGTLPYMSPEQLSGGNEGVDARSDVYSLGVVLYELLSGRVPLDFQGRPLTEIGRMVHDEDPTLLGRYDRAYRGDLETICEKALAKAREQRYATAADLSADLRRWMQSEPIRARRPTTWYQLRRFARRNKAVVLGTAATMLVLVAGLVAVWIYANENRELAVSQGHLRQDAEDARDSLRRSLYAAEMSRASDEIGNPSGAASIRRVVERWAPSAEQPEDLRGWEWRVLRQYSRGALETIRTEDGGGVASLRWVDGGRALQFSMRSGGRRLARRLRSSDWSELPAPASPHAMLAQHAGLGRLVLQSRNGLEVWSEQDDAVLYSHTVRAPTQAGLSPDGKQIAVIGGVIQAGDGRSLLVLDAESGAVVARPGAEHTYGAAALFSADGRYLAAAGHPEPRLYIFDARSWELVHAIECDPARRSVHQACWHPRENKIAVKYRGGSQLTIFDAETGRRVRELEGHRMGGPGLDWSADGHRIAAGGDDESVGVWDLRTGEYAMLGSHDAGIPRVAFHPEGRLVASGGDDGVVRLWDVERPRAIRTVVEPGSRLPRGVQLLFRADGLLCVRDGGRTRLLDPLRGEQRASLDSAHVAWNHDGSLVALRRGAEVLVRRAGDAEILASHRFGPAAHAHMAWHPTKDRLLIPTDEDAYLWEPLQRGAAPRKIGYRRLVSTWWSADGERVGQVLWSNQVAILDAESGRELRKIAVARGYGHAPAPRGSLFATGTEDHFVRLYDAATGSRVAEWSAHGGRVLCVAWSPDGTRIASGGRDRVLRVWDAETRRQVFALRHEEDVTGVAWSPDGTMLASCTRDGRVRVADAGER